MNRSCKYFNGFIIIIILFSLISCTNSKELQYLQGNLDTSIINKLTFPEPFIQVGDILSIIVFSDNAASSKPFNQAFQPQQFSENTISGEMSNTTAIAQTAGYLVNLKGMINFPVIGALKVEGLTKDQLIELLNRSLDKYLLNPYYDIRFKNFKITMMGEVVKPGVYSIPNERVNILEAIGMAGELTFFGKRENVLVIRETNGKRDFGRINLKDPKLFNSPFYYLKQNDIVMIDMSKRKVTANDQVAARNISLAVTIVSAMAVLISVFRR